MDAFIANISSFPTAIFTTLNLFLFCYWLLMLVGFVGLESLDLDIDVDVESSELGSFASALVALGLTGVPFTIVLTVLALLSFTFCYYAVYFGLLITAQGWLEALTGLGISIVSIAVSLPITAKVIRPLRRLFARLNDTDAEKSLLGATCTIRTSSVDADFGEAECSIGGSSFIIKVRSKNTPFVHGDKAVIIEHDPLARIYHIVSVSEFYKS